MEIRLLENKDIEFLNKVRNESVDFLHNKTKFNLEQTKEWFKTLKDPYFIVSNNGIDIGYVRTSKWSSNNKRCYIGMDIAEEHRGKGYAIPSYIKLMLKLATEYGVIRFRLEVLESNKRAKHIYDKIGFKETDRVNYTDKEKSIIMDYNI